MSKSNADAPRHDPQGFWNIFRQLPDSYLLFEASDPVYTIVEQNKVRERLTGVRREEAIGRPLFDVYPDSSEQYQKTGVNMVHEELKQLLKSGQPRELQVLRYDMKDRLGKLQERYWQSTYIPIRDDSGVITHILATTKDVTKTQLSEKRMISAEERLEAALTIGKVGSWVWEVDKDRVVADANLARMFGITQKEVAAGLPLDNFLSAVHKDDRKRVDQAIRRTLRTREPFDEEYRTYASNGKMSWVLARGSVDVLNGEKLFTGVIVDITERRDLQAQVELARKQDQLNRQESKMLLQRNEELEAISRTKDEFVALASHQLRTPATAVKQYIGMVLQGYVGDITELQNEMLAKAFESNERQIQIINQILNAARVDTGRLVMTPVPIDLGALAKGISDEMRSSIEQHGHSLGVVLPKSPVPVHADLGYLRMAIENVLNNAANYTPEGGRIEIRLEKVGNKQARLSIVDNGVGIKKADQGKLFVKFSRIPNQLSVQAGGSGIGLYLTAEIIRLHGGTVTVESKINHGTTFAILLPLVQNT